MPNIYLQRLWENMRSHLEYEKQNSPSSGSEPDDIQVQSSIEFSQEPNIVFVKDINTKKPAQSYTDLAQFDQTLTQSEQRIAQQAHDELAQNPNFYDGDQLIIRELIYDSEQNTLYIEAQQVKFSLLRAYVHGKFPQSSPIYQQNFYKTGVLVPFIMKSSNNQGHYGAQEDHICLIQRSRDKYYSVSGGFIEPYVEKSRKQVNMPHTNLVKYNANNESQEEFLANDVKINPRVTAISMRAGPKIKTIEFIAPARIPYSTNTFQKRLAHNTAKDAHEHNQNHVFVPIGANKRAEAQQFLKQGPGQYPGGFLYQPMLATSALQSHTGFWNHVPYRLPNTRTRIIHTDQLKTTPEKPISTLSDENHSDESCADKPALSWAPGK